MSDWNSYVKQFIPNGNKVIVKKVKKSLVVEKTEDDKQ